MGGALDVKGNLDIGGLNFTSINKQAEWNFHADSVAA